MQATLKRLVTNRATMSTAGSACLRLCLVCGTGIGVAVLFGAGSGGGSGVCIILGGNVFS